MLDPRGRAEPELRFVNDRIDNDRRRAFAKQSFRFTLKSRFCVVGDLNGLKSLLVGGDPRAVPSCILLQAADLVANPVDGGLRGTIAAGVLLGLRETGRSGSVR